MKRKNRLQSKYRREITTPRYTLICEGATEQHYFEHLNKLGKTSVSFAPTISIRFWGSFAASKTP